jgi:pimeloyl-ACP methyl ester carboxylesterase
MRAGRRRRSASVSVVQARPARESLLAAVLAAAVFVLGGCASVPVPGPFYHLAAAPAAGQPGDVLRVEPMPGAPCWLSAFRVLYLSTGLDGQAIPVSAVVVVPRGKAPPGGRKVVAWGHPTTGVASSCAPSLERGKFFGTIPGLSQLLAQGYVVTATDYPGLGTPGPHPYLVGVSEARAVLDSVRAARHLAEAAAGPTFAVWGHSQGGQAALFAGELAAGYAPELSLVGVAAAAPPTDLSALLEAGLGSDVGRLLAAYSLFSWTRVYGAPLSGVVEPSQVPVVDRVAAGCVQNLGQALAVLNDVQPLRSGFPAADPAKVEPWRGLLAQNRPGQRAAGAPLFIAQGTDDVLVRPWVTAEFVESLCRRGEAVHFLEMPGVGHLEAGDKSADAAVAWLVSRFAGKAAPSDCRRRP